MKNAKHIELLECPLAPSISRSTTFAFDRQGELGRPRTQDRNSDSRRLKHEKGREVTKLLVNSVDFKRGGAIFRLNRSVFPSSYVAIRFGWYSKQLQFSKSVLRVLKWPNAAKLCPLPSFEGAPIRPEGPAQPPPGLASPGVVDSPLCERCAFA